jgi:starch-binding outer membrane protein, SusD/RagB family
MTNDFVRNTFRSHNMRFIRYLAAATLVGAAAGCADLEVVNPNNPDRPRVLASPADVEGLASGQFQQIVLATLGSTVRAQTGMMTASFMNASTLANNGMGPRGLIPRVTLDNQPGNAYDFENFNDFSILSSVARNSADILARAKSAEFTLGPGRAGDEARLQAWAHFVSGVAHGYLSLVYDSAGIARFTDARADIPPLSSYQEVNQFALAQFDSALVYLDRPGVTTLPAGWLTGAGGVEVSTAEFRRVVRSFAAKMRADVARNLEERQAVNWQQVIADANAGIQSNLNVRLSPANGWDYQWLATTLHFRDPNWHQMTYYIIGMADVSGQFANWLAQPRDDRPFFTIVTPDLRFPQGATRAEQTRPSGDDDSPLPEGQYFRNRNPGKDANTTGWRASQYDHYRFRGLSDAGRIGNLPFFTQAENDMLAAEGHIRTNNVAAAAALIDRTRTRAGLPALAGVVTSATQPVPGGAQCVPQAPIGQGNSVVCGNIMEAMKWEKRMETAYTTYGAWFFDHRGWNDLPVGTSVHWPVPWQESNARGLRPYNIGGVGREGGATTNTYGYGVGNR